MTYLKTNQILAIHNEVIEQVGGSKGIRDLCLFDSAVARPKSTFAEKIFILIFSQKQLL